MRLIASLVDSLFSAGARMRIGCGNRIDYFGEVNWFQGMSQQQSGRRTVPSGSGFDYFGILGWTFTNKIILDYRDPRCDSLRVTEPCVCVLA
jgi:hypothetical protein